MTTITVRGKKAEIYEGPAGAPAVYLNTFGGEGNQILRELSALPCPACSLIAISRLDWDHDMSPWKIPPISPNDTPCTGGADEYLGLLCGEIIPKVERELACPPGRRVIAGYSLAGLFAVYALSRTDLFDAAGSMSGSLWFPGFLEYALSHSLKKVPLCLYFSLGDRECHTRNRILRPVQQNTERLAAYYRSLGIETAFVLNPGNHYVQAAQRTALGIAWVLNRIPSEA